VRVLDLFAGAGGFSLGFRWARAEIGRAVENHRPKVETYRANFPDVDLIDRDIQDVTVRDPFDVVVGGPPCEPYTSANSARKRDPLARLHDDPIGALVLQFIRIVGDVRPKAFVMENVVQVAEGPLRAELERFFGERGFPKIHFNELKSEDAGVPSHRLRLFISNVPLKLKHLHEFATVDEAIESLPPPGPSVPNHDPHPLSDDKREAIARLRPGDSLYGYRSATGKQHQNWLRVRGDRPAPTVMGQARFVHPREDRLLTPREHARLMGFPDDFVLKGGRDQQYDAVGEAVPPALAKQIALQVQAALAKA
jgi:DNA (cytosine-5)-methyltransferase 1